MKIAVVTPYYKETTDKLARCVSSVENQTHPCTHIMVADGHPNAYFDQANVQHIVLPQAHGDFGDTPRCIGTMAAYSQGFDAVCWLDADNWFEPNHIATMVELMIEHGVSVVTASRNLYSPTGAFIGLCTESDGINFNDTNCYFLSRKAMPLAAQWVFKDKAASVVGDRVIFSSICKSFPARFHCRTPTVNYETYVAGHYLERGMTPHPEARIIFRMENEENFQTMLYSEFVKLSEKKDG
jgi:hypothetical protein